MDLQASSYEFQVVFYEEGAPALTPAGEGWFYVAFAASQSADARGNPERTGAILWARLVSSGGNGPVQP